MGLRWFTGSRYIKALESLHAEQRADYLERVAEKNAEIRRLRMELGQVKAELERLRVVPTDSQPKPSPMRVVPSADTLDWQGELNRLITEEEDGIRSSGRIQEHQPGADDGA